MKYPKINEAVTLEAKHSYPDGAVYLTPSNAAAIEAALNSAAVPAESNSEVQALNTQLEVANTNLANAQSHIANLEAQNATLQAENTRLGNLPAANNAAALTGSFQEEQPGEEGAEEPEWNNPELAHNKAAAALGLF